MKNFKNISEDYDDIRYMRELVGRVTDQRVEAVKRFVEVFNEENRYPYGQGYSCGHVHDCCGCLSSTYMSHDVTENSIKIYYNETYNY